MNKIELNKMVVDTALGNLKDKLYHIIDGIASAKALDQYNAKCEEIERLQEALKTVTVNLIACHSLLGAGGKSAAASDKMFEIMMSDYAKAIEVGRSTAWPETLVALQPKDK